ncbi:hypothetical protein [Sulfitobacter sp.]|uniref:hypothetical protein n=1 Tax=Sulfitobacter sp. TaxID=1903071 RepID=UPI003002A43D
MNDFRNGAEFQALMVSLGRIENVNQIAFEAAQASERKPQGHHDRRRLEQENKLLGRQLRAALLCSAYSIAEAAIIGLTPHELTTNSDIKKYFGLGENERPIPLHRSQFVLQQVFGLCKTDQWNEDWLDLHRLRLLRNRLVHSGGVGEEDNLSKKIDRDAGFAAWVEPMFEGSEAEIYVLVVGEMHFRQRLQKLQKFIYDIDAELPRIVT